MVHLQQHYGCGYKFIRERNGYRHVISGCGSSCYSLNGKNSMQLDSSPLSWNRNFIPNSLVEFQFYRGHFMDKIQQSRMHNSQRRALTNGDGLKATVFFYLALVLAAANASAASPDNSNVSFTSDERNHWAFQNITRPKPPKIDQAERVRNPIDAFVVAELKAKGLKPAALADKVTLIRRATFDLIGLPPTPEEVDAFLADDSTKAFDKVVDHLLASPRSEERRVGKECRS